jgi:tRNA dimethylallyltransferase
MKQQIPPELLRQCIFLAGPTASGKTDVAIRLAENLGDVEIVSLDSMCIYREMDIGTAKPSAALREQVPHHLIDIVDPHEDYSVADYIRDSHAVCEAIVARGATPLFVGGTGLYLRGILRGVFHGPPADPAIRARYEKQAAEAAAKGDNFYLMSLLERVDVDATMRLHPNDHRRLIRALEVYEITGIPLSKQQKQPALPEGERPENVFWLDAPREWLHERINRRVELMIEAGLVEEVQRLAARQPPTSHTARQGLGYKEVIDALDEDQQLVPEKLPEVVETIQARTRQFSKRQYTMFRNTEECHAVEFDGTETAEQLCDKIRGLLKK